MALLKGFLAVVTVVPDSAGWDGCQERLGDAGLRYFRNREGLDPNSEVLWSITSFFKFEALGVWFQSGSRNLHFCADTMFSGHTYVCVIFSLGLYDLIRNQSRKFKRFWRGVIRTLTGFSLLGLVSANIVIILLNRLHYTMDCAVAIVLSFLFFSNPAVTLAVEMYVKQITPTAFADSAESKGVLLEHVADLALRPDLCAELGRVAKEPLDDRGSVLVPPCCIPFCFTQGRYHLHCEADADLQRRRLINLLVCEVRSFADEKSRLEAERDRMVKDLRSKDVQAQAMNSRWSEMEKRYRALEEESKAHETQARLLHEEKHHLYVELLELRKQGVESRAAAEVSEGELAHFREELKALQSSKEELQRRLLVAEESVAEMTAASLTSATEQTLPLTAGNLEAARRAPGRSVRAPRELAACVLRSLYMRLAMLSPDASVTTHAELVEVDAVDSREFRSGLQR